MPDMLFMKFVFLAILLVSSFEGFRCQTDEDDDKLKLVEETWAELAKLKKETNEQLTIFELKNIQLTRNLTAALSKIEEQQTHIDRLENLLKKSQESFNELSTKGKQFKDCPNNIGGRSNCKELSDMGCYCIVEEQKSLPAAKEYCSRHGMELVSIETKEEQDLLADFLSSNLGSRSKYDAGLWTSGFDEHLDGQWQWTSSKRPLLYRNWSWYNEGRSVVLVRTERPFDWFPGRVKNEDGGLFTDFSICESSSPRQETKNLVPFINSKVCPQTIGVNSTCVYLDPLGCYCAVLTEMAWIEASRHCKSHQMELVSIESEEEHLQIAAFLHEKNPWWGYWSSGLYHEEKSQWVWTSTGQPITNAKWRENEPSFKEGQGHVVLFQRSTSRLIAETSILNNIFYNAHYICEKSGNATTKHRWITASASCSAGAGWTCHSEVTGCYCYQTITRNWTDASAACQRNGMKLISIESALEQMLVASILPGRDNWWTSGSEAGGEKWKWATGDTFTYTNWAQDEPKKIDDTEHAVKMYFESANVKSAQHTWSVWPKTKEFNPLCEK